MANNKISSRFLKAAQSEIYSSDRYTVEESVSLRDYLQLVNPKLLQKTIEAEVVAKAFDWGITEKIKVGNEESSIEIPLSKKSLLSEGDKVDVDTIVISLYIKPGKKDKIYADGELVEEPAE